MSRRNWIIVAVVGVLLVGAVVGFVVNEQQRQQALDDEDHGWADCVAPRVAEVPDMGTLGDDYWPEASLSTQLIAEFNRGTGMEQAPDGSLLLTQQDGRLQRMLDGEAELVLDFTGQVADGVEQGLLDIELDLDRGWAYLTLINLDEDLELWAYDLDADGIPVDGTGRILMTIDEPHEWHNGGDVEIGPDGMLWMSAGDGGHIADPFRHGQNPDTPLGTILRIEPTADGYEVPDDNPDLGRDADERVVAFGFRNPWRIDFAPDGLLWVADVGQYCAEEVSIVDPADLGGNYGWSNLEGSYRFVGQIPEEHVLPAFEYSHDDGGCSITGAGIYRGAAIPELVGMYVFADYCRGRVMALELDASGTVVDVHRLGVQINLIQAIEADADGELYLLTQEQGVHKLVP